MFSSQFVFFGLGKSRFFFKIFKKRNSRCANKLQVKIPVVPRIYKQKQRQIRRFALRRFWIRKYLKRRRRFKLSNSFILRKLVFLLKYGVCLTYLSTFLKDAVVSKKVNLFSLHTFFFN